MSVPERVAVDEVHRKVNDGAALLVCAYDDDEKFHGVHLEGAVSMTEFKTKLSGLDRNQEIFFYCA